MYSLPLAKKCPVTILAPTLAVHKTPAASALTAWLEMSLALPIHSPAQVKITAASHRWSRLAQPHTFTYAGSQTAIHANATHRRTGNAGLPLIQLASCLAAMDPLCLASQSIPFRRLTHRCN